MGLVIRCCLIAIWLALLGLHLWRFALPGLGVVERHDLGSALAQQIDRALTYDLLNASGKRLGGSELSVVREDAGFRCDLRLELTGLPGINLGQGTSAQVIRLAASEKLDDRFRLTALTAEGEVMGLSVAVEAIVDHRGLSGTLSLAGKEQPFALAGFDRQNGAAMDFGVTLPPGLEPGDRFKTTLLDLDLSLTPREKEAVFSVERREMLATRGGPLELLKVLVSSDGRHRSTYWCDRTGTVYRAELGNRTLAMELVRVRQLPGQVVWPQP